MIKFLFLLPISLCLLWVYYLKFRGYSISQGKQGFRYILLFSAVVFVFYLAIMWLSRSQINY